MPNLPNLKSQMCLFSLMMGFRYVPNLRGLIINHLFKLSITISL